MVQYDQGYRETTIETVDRENAILIEKVQLGLISELQEDDSVLEAMMSAGLTVRLTETTRSSIVKALTWSFSRIRNKHPRPHLLDVHWSIELSECTSVWNKS